MSDPYEEAYERIQRRKLARDPVDPALDEQRGQLRTSLYGSVTENPDQAAKSLQLSRQTGLPPDVVGRNLPEVERNQKVIEADQALTNHPKVTGFLSDPAKARISHDDVGNLARTEESVKALRGPTPTVGSYLYGLYRSLPQGAEATRQGYRAQFADLINSQEMHADAMRKYAATTLEQASTTPDFETATARAIYGGLSSTIRQAPGLLGAVLTRNPKVGLATIGGQVEGDMYGKYRARGATPAEALYGAVHEGAIEVITEILPMGFLVKQFGKVGAGQFLSGLLMREIPSEQVATLAQDAVDTAVANPEKTWAQYLEERPGAAYETLVSTVTQAGTMAAANTAIGRLNNRTQKAADAEKNTQLFTILDGLSKASKVRERDPATFQDFVKQATEDGPVTDVYVDARVFAQSLQDAGGDLAAVSQAAPAVGEQLRDALLTGGDLRIPVDQYTAAIAGSDYSQSLIPHLKTEAGGMTQLEAADFMQNHGKELEAMVDQVLGEKKGDDDFKASRDNVTENIRGQLNEAGRFTDDVNLAKASLIGNFFAVQGAKLGMTAEQMYDQYKLQVQATQAEAGTAMDQFPAEFRNWFGASRVMDRFRRPMVMYHGTPNNITAFRRGKADAIYVSQDPEFANTFAMRGMGVKDPTAGFEEGLTPNVMPVYVRAENPFDYESEEHLAGLGQFLRDNADSNGEIKLGENDISMSVERTLDYIKTGAWDAIESPLAQAYIVSAGHDSFYQSEEGQKNLGVFDPTQIKSAIGNNGNFDPSNPNILEQASPATDASGMFDPDLLASTAETKFKSREKLISMNIDDFLAMAKPGFSEDKLGPVKATLASGGKFVDIPFLKAYRDEDGNLKVEGHEGRHRARALQAAGFKTMPVRLISDIRWSEQLDPARRFDYIQTWPEALIAEEGDHSIPMPVARGQAAANYEAPSQGGTFFQSVTLRTGKEQLLMGAERGRSGYYLNRDLGIALEARQRKKYGTIARDDQSDEAAKKISKWMIDEVIFEIGNSADSGTGWYKEKFQKTLDMVADEEGFPELRTDKTARDMLTVLFGITSDGSDPVINFRTGVEIYAGFRKTGKLTATAGHNRDYTLNLAALQKLHDTMGPVDMHEYLMQQKTVKELRQIAKKAGVEIKVEYQPHIVIPMASLVLGPKVGVFYGNMMGAHQYLTMDRWWSRTFNRMRGQLLTTATESGKANVKNLLGNPNMDDQEMLVAIAPIVKAYEKSGYKDKTEIAVAANTVWKNSKDLEDTPFTVTDRTFMIKTVGLVQKGLSRRGVKLDIDDIQAVLWYYEKRLYADMGAKPTATNSYYEVAQKAYNKSAGAGTDISGGSVPQGDGKAAEVDARGQVGRPGDVGVSPDQEGGTFNQSAVYTDAPAFRWWFGNSLVVDDQGKPLVVYHGTITWEKDGKQLGDIQAFDRLASTNIVGRKASIDTVGSWFSTNPGKGGAGMYGTAIYPVYLSIKNPHETTFAMMLRRARMLQNGKDDGRDVGQAEVDAYRKWLKTMGKDGIKIVHDEGAANNSTEFKEQDAWIVLEPEQIKSAVGNSGAFDPASPNIMDQEARGSISFPKDITAAPSIITLLNNADLSTFLHESGHFFLQVMADMASKPGAPQNVTDDIAQLLRWFGVPDLATWNKMSVDEQRPHHESFARGFESYLLEGKAPTPELQPLYQKFRSWMLNVYKQLLQLSRGDAGSALKVSLTPEVRAVMDRMVATSETIKEAEDAQGYGTLFDTKPDGMTDAEWAQYQELGQAATQDAISYLEGRSLRDMRWASNAKSRILKRLQDEVEDKRAAVRAEVAAEVMAEPINQVRTFLRDGEIDGDPVPGPHKLSIEGLEEMYGSEDDRYALLDWKALSTSGKAAAEGIHPDEMAADFGFRSGDELVQALLQEDTAPAKIDQLTDQRMLERYGDLTDAATIDRAANEAVHNEARAKFVATELAALSKAAGEKPLLAKAAKAFAQAAVARKKIRDIKPHEYSAAARKASQAAAKAMRAGDLQTAAVEKRNQLINEYAAQAAHKALASTDKKVTYLRKVGSTRAQEKMRGDSVAQLLAILDRFDIRKAQSLKEIDRRQALAEWAKDEASRLAAPEPILSQKVLDEANRTHFKNLTLEEFDGLVDSVRQLEQLARREHKAFIELRNLTIQEEVAAGVAEIQAAFPEAFDGEDPKLDTPLTNRYVPSLGKKLKEGIRNIIAEFVPMEDLVDRLTAGKFGQLHDSIFGRLSDAADRKAMMAGGVRERLKPLLDAYTMKEKRDFARKEIPGTNMTRENVVMLALHWGNVEGRQRLESQGFSEAIMLQRLRHLTAKDVDLINGIWNLNDGFIWPQYSDLNQRTQGKALAKVEPVPFTFTTAAGGNVTLAGGYVKLVYDSDFDESTRQRDSMADAISMIAGRTGSAAPKTDQGSSKARISDLSRMPLLELRAVAQAVNEHLHDITFREAVADTVRILREPKMRDAIKAVAGREVYTELLAKVNEIAARPVEPSGAVLRGLNAARKNTVVVLMSGVKTALVNYSGLVPALTRVNAGSLARSLAKVHSHRMVEMIRFAQAKSIYMRERQQSFTSDLQQQLDAMSVKNRILPEMGTFLILMRKIDQLTSTTVWLAGYEDGLKRFKQGDGTPDEARAIEYANNVTRSTQGSGRDVDTSKIMTRFGPWAKLFTMFYSFFNKQAALLARQGLLAEREWTKGNRATAVGLFTASYVAIVAIPAMINDLASGKCDDAIEGDEGWGRCVSKALAMNMAGFVPIVRDLAPYAWSLVDDKDPTFGLRMTSISAYFEGVAKGAASTLDVINDEANEKDTKAIFMGLAFSFGLPGVLMWNVGAGTEAFIEGDAGPQAVLFGPPKK